MPDLSGTCHSINLNRLSFYQDWHIGCQGDKIFVFDFFLLVSKKEEIFIKNIQFGFYGLIAE